METEIEIKREREEAFITISSIVVGTILIFPDIITFQRLVITIYFHFENIIFLIKNEERKEKRLTIIRLSERSEPFLLIYLFTCFFFFFSLVKSNDPTIILILTNDSF